MTAAPEHNLLQIIAANCVNNYTKISLTIPRNAVIIFHSYKSRRQTDPEQKPIVIVSSDPKLILKHLRDPSYLCT